MGIKDWAGQGLLHTISNGHAGFWEIGYQLYAMAWHGMVWHEAFGGEIGVLGVLHRILERTIE